MNRRDMLTAAAGVAAIGAAAVIQSNEAYADTPKREIDFHDASSYSESFLLITGIRRWVADQKLDGLHGDIVLTREQFKLLSVAGDIDWFHRHGQSPPDDSATYPFIYNHPVKVPGTALA